MKNQKKRKERRIGIKKEKKRATSVTKRDIKMCIVGGLVDRSTCRLSNLVPVYFELLLASLLCIAIFLFISCFATFISTVCVSWVFVRSALGLVCGVVRIPYLQLHHKYLVCLVIVLYTFDIHFITSSASVFDFVW